MNLTEQLVDIAKQIDKNDPIDWGMLAIDEDNAYRMMAASVLENYLANDKDQREMIMLATMTHLVVENFVLNMKLLEKHEAS